ncbi:MAG TPA: nuclease-related domain-containing protein, partial [Methanobacteriaceae archaeon]|nr:nuclease-related domain-containing protein [Methanobacteriaceae archaeon]
DYFVYHDVTLASKRGNIDHVVIGPTGIFVIETKNYSGKYRIKGDKWFYYKRGNFHEARYNPGSQVTRNTQNIKLFLQKRGINTSKVTFTSLVAFICSDFRVIETPRDYKVLLPQTVPEYILNGKINQNINSLKEAALELEPYCVELTFSN